VRLEVLRASLLDQVQRKLQLNVSWWCFSWQPDSREAHFNSHLAKPLKVGAAILYHS